MSSPSGFVRYPREARRALRGLPWSAHAVYAHLLLAANHRDWTGTTSAAAISEQLGGTRTTASSALAALAGRGIIEYHKGANQYERTRYRVLLNHDAVQSESWHGVQIESQQLDSTALKVDSNLTAHRPAPAETRPLEPCISLQERCTTVAAGPIPEIVRASRDKLTERQARDLAKTHGAETVRAGAERLASDIAHGSKIVSFHAVLAHRLKEGTEDPGKSAGPARPKVEPYPEG